MVLIFSSAPHTQHALAHARRPLAKGGGGVCCYLWCVGGEEGRRKFPFSYRTFSFVFHRATFHRDRRRESKIEVDNNNKKEFRCDLPHLFIPLCLSACSAQFPARSLLAVSRPGRDSRPYTSAHIPSRSKNSNLLGVVPPFFLGGASSEGCTFSISLLSFITLSSKNRFTATGMF